MSVDISREAVIFSGSGCGSVDAYGVGVVKALAEKGSGPGELRFEPSIFSGSAFGAFNAVMMVADAGGGTLKTIRRLEEVWLDVIASTAQRSNGVYRMRGVSQCDPAKWWGSPLSTIADGMKDAVYLAEDFVARVRSHLDTTRNVSVLERAIDVFAATPLFDMAPLRATFAAHVDLARVRASAKALMVNATDWQGGIGRIFTNADMTDERGYRILQASAAYLLVFPFVEIDGRPFGGGPGSLATPLRPVVEAWGARTERLTVHTIYLHPPMPLVPIGKMPGMFSGMGRYFDMVESLNERADVEYGGGQAPPPVANQHVRGRITIHRYRPSTPIVDWIDTIDFDRGKTEAFIAQGYRDALGHDCAAAGCSEAV